MMLIHPADAMSFKPVLRCRREGGVVNGGSLHLPFLILLEGDLDHAAKDVLARVLAADPQHGTEGGFCALLGDHAVQGEAGRDRGDRARGVGGGRGRRRLGIVGGRGGGEGEVGRRLGCGGG